MPGNQLLPGDVIAIRFPRHDPHGREQEGFRPAIVIGQPEQLGQPRYSVVLVVPLTRDKGQPWVVSSPNLYPRFPAGTAGLRSSSIALLDQVRSVDVTRILNFRGTLSLEEYRPVQKGLRAMLAR